MALAAANLNFTSSFDDAGIEACDVVFIAVPAPASKDGNPDLSYVKAAADSIGERLGNRFTVVVNESTVPVGSGNWVGALLREAYNRCKGCKPNGNYAMASNPEFLRQGSAIFDALYPDRIVIGSKDPRAIDTLTNLYQPLLNQDFTAPGLLPRPKDFNSVPVVTCDLTFADLTKYAANAFLALKISYINEIGQLADKVGADITKVAYGIGLDPRIGPRFLQAGIGWGGSCLGKDTSALISTAQEYNLSMPILQAARDVNNIQRMWVVKTLLNELKFLKGRTIALLGFAYKPLTDDLRDAPSLDIVRHLIQHGGSVHATDPMALENARNLYPDLGVVYFDQPFDALREADAVVLVTEWPEYRSLITSP